MTGTFFDESMLYSPGSSMVPKSQKRQTFLAVLA
jgi:hypothetical protein